METIKVKNLSSILFYSGDERENAALTTEGRIFGKSCEGYGELVEEDNKQINWKKYSDINFEETKPDYEVLSDIFSGVISYTAKVDTTVGDLSIIDSKYSANYTYEVDLSNKFGNATNVIQSDLKKFLVNCNLNNYNKRKYYTYDNKYNSTEVRSIQYNKVDYKWYPEGTTAYSEPHLLENQEGSYSYTYTKVINLSEDALQNVSYNVTVYQDNINSKRPLVTKATPVYSEVIQLEPTEDNPEPEKVLATETTTYTYSYTYLYDYYWEVPYVIGGNYYSYVMKTYEVFDTMLTNAISYSLEEFAEKYNHDESIYAYYMYDCKPNVEFTFNTYSLGLKKTNLNFTFDSDYNEWYTYSIDLHAKITADKDNPVTIADISGVDGQIYNIKLNEKTNLTGENILYNESNSYTHVFKAITNTEETDNITILTPYKITNLTLGSFVDTEKSIFTNSESFVGTLDLTKNNWPSAKGNCLRKLSIDNTNIDKIIGLNEFQNLQLLSIANCSKIESISIDKLPNLSVLYAQGSSIDSFIPMVGTTLSAKLPSTIKTIKLINNTLESFDYTVNDTLSSLTLNNVKGINSFELVSNWYNCLKDNNKLDSVIYLDLQGFNWENVDSKFMIDIKKFDICNLIGEAHLIGTGDDNKLTRTEYRNILNTYGEDAFELSPLQNILQLYSPGFETYEFNISVKNDDTLIDNDGWIMELTDEVSEDGTQVTSYYKTSWDEQIKIKAKLDVTIENNRAGNAFLDDININPSRVYTIDNINKYVYFTLNNPYDTDDTIQVDNKVQYIDIKKGDIMLFNGNQICIFFENVTNYNYNYIKLGHFDDITYKDDDLNEYSSIVEMLVNRAHDESKNTVSLTFYPAVKPEVTTTSEPTV